MNNKINAEIIRKRLFLKAQQRHKEQQRKEQEYKKQELEIKNKKINGFLEAQDLIRIIIKDLKLTCPVHIFNTEVSVIGDMTASYKYYYDVGEDKLCCKIKKLNTLKFFHPEDFMDEEDYEYETVHFSNLKRFIEFFEEKIEKYIKVS